MKFNGVYYIVFDQITTKNDIWYVQMKLNTVLLEPLQEKQEENYAKNITEFK